MQSWLKNDIFKGILGGLAIGLGCIGYLMCPDRVSGAFIFSLGLLTILTFRWKLFTGIICTSFDPVNVIVSYASNMVGIIAMAILFTVKAWGNLESVQVLAAKKMNEAHFQRIFAGILCEFCIYIAVAGYRKITSEVGKCLIVVLSVMAFVLSGFEHSIADMFYMLVGRPGFWSIIFVIEVTIGNLFGAFCIRNLTKFAEK